MLILELCPPSSPFFLLCSLADRGRSLLLREHIYRVHTKELVCGRCAEQFKNKGELDAHWRAKDVCEIKNSDPGDYISDAQKEKIRSRPKKDKSTNEQKWTEIYKIIFPDTPEDSIPSPCKPPLPIRVLWGLAAELSLTSSI